MKKEEIFLLLDKLGVSRSEDNQRIVTDWYLNDVKPKKEDGLTPKQYEEVEGIVRKILTGKA